ncbi:DapA [Desulforapulum autotrophicum HRM2]|uniref:4-hydroxy-tetrahydrodipicolinate synthase n=1 Tax=Desulforapulum autotrophicum (strain ATCC 43914 / DSM 3382 / VKM B-1955 / HRM2) TaxID=177437 RepID=C0QD66_DESAH|nr:4-hydroxy-tetrahydrodipicolinate synthase [Desulforapulum autotrophicum]ACN17298.1 DapA [Desulforapulum autotrophicum HRM2]
MKTGCYTALITPFTNKGELDGEGLDRLIKFQIQNNITGILAAGTTGESPTLKWEEHNRIIAEVAKAAQEKCLCIAGTGSNNTHEALDAVRHAARAGADAVLLVDPYYNGPSSLEIRREYIEPVARSFPDMQIIPYIIPGRTGTQLLPEDLALAAKKYPNITTVKEATGNIDNMRRTRECCGENFTIMSGDDSLVLEMMTDPAIGAAGGFSVMSNIAPKAMADLVMLLDQGRQEAAEKLQTALAPLLDLVTVTTVETTPFGRVKCRARNPLALKTLMRVMGMPSGACRAPMGKMTHLGLETVITAARKIQAQTPWIFAPVADFFGVDIDERLDNPEHTRDLWYDYEQA